MALFRKSQKIMKNAYYKFPRIKVLCLNVMFCLNNIKKCLIYNNVKLMKAYL